MGKLTLIYLHHENLFWICSSIKCSCIYLVDCLPSHLSVLLGHAHKGSLVQVISRGVSSRSVGLLFLKIFGILEGNFSYFVEFICCTYNEIKSRNTSRTVNFWNLVPSKKIIYRRGIFPISFPNLGI